MYTRREWAAMMASAIDSRIKGVRIGLQTYVFTANTNLPQDRWLDLAIQTMTEAGIGECDLFAPLTDAPDLWRNGRPARADVAAWRASVSLDHFTVIRKRFHDAGIEIHGVSGFSGSTPEDFQRTAEITEALGAKLITLYVTMAAARKIAPLAEKLDVTIGMQGRPDLSVTDPEMISTPERFLEAASLARNYRISLDVGDAVGGGWDALKFVREHPERLHLIYLKDRRKDKTSVPWGQGDTPLGEILRLIRDRRDEVRCYIDCDYKSEDRPEDIRRSFAFVRAALA